MACLSAKEIQTRVIQRSRLYAQLRPSSPTSDSSGATPRKLDPMDVDDYHTTHQEQSEISSRDSSNETLETSNKYTIPSTHIGEAEFDAFVSESNRLLLNEIITSLPTSFLDATHQCPEQGQPTSAVANALLAIKDYVTFTEAEADNSRQRVSSLESQNVGLIRTRSIEVERLRSVSKGLEDQLEVKEKDLLLWKGMAMDRDGEVRRYERMLEGARESENESEAEEA